MKTKHTITFSREALDQYIAERDKAKEKGSNFFIWKNSLVTIADATSLINKLEASRNLSISYETCSCM